MMNSGKGENHVTGILINVVIFRSFYNGYRSKKRKKNKYANSDIGTQYPNSMGRGLFCCTL